MTLNPLILQAVERLDYRVTIGDVAAHSGLELNLAQQGAIELASQVEANLKVTDTGEIVYLFPRNFRDILRNKFWQLRFQEWLQKIWQVIFYLIRISFGIILIISIVLMLAAVILIVVASIFKDSDSSSGGSSSSNSSGRSSGGFWFPLSIFDIFSTDRHYTNHSYSSDRSRSKKQTKEKDLNFLEAIFSFLFGDGNPNYDLEKRRWQSIATVINNNRGAVIGEQITPYLDELTGNKLEDESYILPVLARFNGYPEVSDAGEIIYYFPDLQVTANNNQKQNINSHLSEQLWQFSQAGSGQNLLAIGLGGLNIILALVLGYFIKTGAAAQTGGFVVFVTSSYWILLSYGMAFLLIPLIRYFWVQWRNHKIEQRNQKRRSQADLLRQNLAKLQQKLNFARQFARQQVITEADIAYTTETDLIDQNIQQKEKLDREWRKRLDEN
jgi:flagellar basal body-associated protein FliL